MRGTLHPWLAAAALLLLPGAGWAGDDAEALARDLGPSVEARALDGYRGRQNSTSNLEMNWQENNGTVEGNRAMNTVNGANIIRDGAFSHSNGLPIMVQNSGNNVLIQNSVILNLEMQ
jgi:hypothetical protein